MIVACIAAGSALAGFLAGTFFEFKRIDRFLGRKERET